MNRLVLGEGVIQVLDGAGGSELTLWETADGPQLKIARPDEGVLVDHKRYRLIAEEIR
ncbi:hypothetical protein [Methylobacter sp.]|uniref:hypothetical protein n=1 Tax=Methylobacter sp. TaxID=2051955 RepID=UPI0025D6DCEA|nr:hypothetical protein [Methylobacter sp.]